jgi:hypothetical protein
MKASNALDAATTVRGQAATTDRAGEYTRERKFRSRRAVETGPRLLAALSRNKKPLANHRQGFCGQSQQGELQFALIHDKRLDDCRSLRMDAATIGSHELNIEAVIHVVGHEPCVTVTESDSYTA